MANPTQSLHPTPGRVRDLLNASQPKSRSILAYQQALRTCLKAPIDLNVARTLVKRMQATGADDFLGISDNIDEIILLLTWQRGDDDDA